jgi:hypothetical protein
MRMPHQGTPHRRQSHTATPTEMRLAMKEIT